MNTNEIFKKKKSFGSRMRFKHVLVGLAALIGSYGASCRQELINGSIVTEPIDVVTTQDVSETTSGMGSNSEVRSSYDTLADVIYDSQPKDIVAERNTSDVLSDPIDVITEQYGSDVSLEIKDNSEVRSSYDTLADVIYDSQSKDIVAERNTSDVLSDPIDVITEQYGSDVSLEIKDNSEVRSSYDTLADIIYDSQLDTVMGENYSDVASESSYDTPLIDTVNIAEVLSDLIYDSQPDTVMEGNITDAGSIYPSDLGEDSQDSNELGDYGCVDGACVELQEEVKLCDFDDKNLQNNVCAELGKNEGCTIDLSEAEKITMLSAYGAGTAKLNGIECLTNLTWLNLNFNQISDISSLAGLINLKYLYLNGNQISDISSLAGLTNLEYFYLDTNPISDISSLAGLTNLTWLDLNTNQISDISSLAGLTNLEQLYLNGNQVSDISSLAGLTNLKDLNLNVNPISDISSLAGLTNLGQLYLNENQISDISSLANLANLEQLYLNFNHISDISSLAGLTNLKYLYLNGNQVSDISSLADLTNLEQLYLNFNQISDISSLADLTNLEQLGLNVNKISDISSLAGLTNLGQLYLSINKISDISSLVGLTNLEQLYLSGNQVSDTTSACCVIFKMDVYGQLAVQGLNCSDVDEAACPK